MTGSAKPRAVAKWVVIGYAFAILAFLLINADAADSALLGLIFWPWLAGPALLAAFATYRAETRWAAWSCVVVLLLVPLSFAALLIYLDTYPDAQNGIAVVIFPALQFAFVTAAVLIVAVIEHLLGRRDPPRIDG